MKWLLTIIPIILIADQYTKWLIRQKIALYEKIVVIDGFFNLTHVQNAGAAFGLFSDMDKSFRVPFFYSISLIAFVILIYLFINTSPQEWRMRGILTLITGGALGNVTDRILFGSVTDFIQVYYKSFSWPSFNVADSCITVGVILLFIEMIFFNKEQIMINNTGETSNEVSDNAAVLTEDSL
ncbi:signal peptidase II [candidate division CSSED10-310 bacterium]|uniref:Lipoprotein signal peptidase n=1 Tax=candidate division CSSED10-310 bacterium TaxID=2855610 RepID=A0ABV6Z0M2_UNCC1